MPINHKKSIFAFLTALFFTLATPILFPKWHILFFAPYLVILYYQKPFYRCLWSSFFCGLLIDLLSADTHLGLHATSYCFATWMIYGQRQHFFADSVSTLPLMSSFFCVMATLAEYVLIHIFERSVTVTWYWMAINLIYLTAFTAFYSFVWFILPGICFGRRPLRGKDYFLN